jgi:hypothetical protein
MKRELKSDPKKKATMIKMIAEAIDKNTKDEHEVFQVVRALRNVSCFISDQRWELEGDIGYIIHRLEDDIRTKGSGAFLEEFRKMTEIALEVVMISNQDQEGINILEEMTDDLKAVSTEYGII